MKPACKWVSVAFVAAALMMSTAASWAAPQEQQQQAKPNYTLAEYNAYQAAHNEKDPQMKLKALDDFVMKYPGSALLFYVYGDYFQTYNALKNYPKTIEYVDKFLALPDAAKPEQIGTRLQAFGYRSQAMLYGSGDKELTNSGGLHEGKGRGRTGFAGVGPMAKATGHDRRSVRDQQKGIGGPIQFRGRHCPIGVEGL